MCVILCILSFILGLIVYHVGTKVLLYALIKHEWVNITDNYDIIWNDKKADKDIDNFFNKFM